MTIDHTFDHTLDQQTRLGLTPDELVSKMWSGAAAPAYAARLSGLNVLAGETLALVGDGTAALLDRLSEALADSARIDGAVAAAGGTVRIQAVQAARVGVRALTVSDPFVSASSAAIEPAVRALALADLAGLTDLGVTTVVAIADVTLAALVADRVVVVAAGRPLVAYPVLAPTPRCPEDVAPVTQRVSGRLLAGA